MRVCKENTSRDVLQIWGTGVLLFVDAAASKCVFLYRVWRAALGAMDLDQIVYFIPPLVDHLPLTSRSLLLSRNTSSGALGENYRPTWGPYQGLRRLQRCGSHINLLLCTQVFLSSSLMRDASLRYGIALGFLCVVSSSSRRAFEEAAPGSYIEKIDYTARCGVGLFDETFASILTFL